MNFKLSIETASPSRHLLALLPLALISACSENMGESSAMETTRPAADFCSLSGNSTLTDTRLTSARLVAPGEDVEGARFPPGGSPVHFCQLEGVIKEEIGFELWLPLPYEWNGNMQSHKGTGRFSQRIQTLGHSIRRG